MQRTINYLIAAQLMLVSLVAAAAGPLQVNEAPRPYRNKPLAEGATVWYCNYSGKLSIHCRLGQSGTPAAAEAKTLNLATASVARRILEAPEGLAGMLVEIPLRAPPFEFAQVGLLAESVMCGARDGCGIVFGENSAQLAQFVLWRDANRRSRHAAPVMASIAQSQ